MASSERRATAHEQIFGPRGPPRPPPPRGYEMGGRADSVQYPQYAQFNNYQPPSAMYYPQPPPQTQHPHMHPHYGQPQLPPQPPPPPMYGPRPSPAPRPRSMLSGGGSGYLVGIIPARPLPEDAPDPAIERLTQQGLTPAQAYQAQYQQNTPRPLQLPLVEITQDPPISGPWDYERREEDVRSDRGSVRDWASSRHSMYQPGHSPPLYTNPIQRPQLMHLDTTLAAQASPAAHTSGDTMISYYHSESTSPSPPISNAPVNLNPSASRRSIESVRTVPVGTNTGSIGRRGHTYTGSIGNAPSDRIRSMSASGSTTSRPPLPIPRPNHPTSRRRPLVYPALLSRVADAFRQRILLSDRTKDSLTYPAAFDGREAVDLISFIIKTSDRNLALLLGRALDAQKFFHDVTYDHRLRDSPAEIYQFSGPRPVASWDIDGAEDGESTPVRPGLLSPGQGSGSGAGSTNAAGNATGEAEGDAVPLPVGVFTLLTECYSPTCSRDKVCYCIGCPRRVEQNTRQQSQRSYASSTTTIAASTLSGTTIAVGGATAMANRFIKANSSKESLIDHGLKEPGQLWVQSVPQEIVDSVSDQERKRQEAINEVIYTERDFVRDLEYLRDRWMEPLRKSDIIPEERRDDFVQQVFWNVEDILDVNARLRDLLTKRQNAYPIVETIGDIFLELVSDFHPFVQYGKHQLYGKYEFEKEKSTNPAFASFVETVERLPESRKLELNGYLTKPTTRLARYPLLLEVVLKHTPEDNVDKVALPKVVAKVREFLKTVNEESGKTENRFNLLQLDKGLVFRPGEEADLRLKEEGRQLVYKGVLKRRGGTANENGDLQVFLFDHALLMVKSKMVSKHEQLKVFKRPIPLELLVVSTPDENANRAARPRTTLIRPNGNGQAANGTPPPAAPTRPDSQKSGYQLTFSYLGKKGYSLTLWAPTVIARKKWVDHIVAQQEAMRERSMMFDTYMLSEGVFLDEAKVNCSVPYDYGRRFAYGTDDGIYFQSLHDAVGKPIRKIALPDVQQIDILEDYQLLVALAERSVVTIPLEAIDVDDVRRIEDPLKRMKRISSHTSFFKAGYCLGRTLVCVVKASSLSSTIKVLEPIEQSIRGKSKPTFKKLLQGGNDTLKVFKEFYIPNESLSIHFLKTKLCVACTTGFEIVDLETLDTQALLDPVDVSLDFVQRRDDVRPLSIYRVDGEFLLCYTEFAFFVNKSGWRSKKDVTIYWEGTPTAFALHYPYVMAFDPTFIEIRHVENGSLVQVIRGSNLRLLFADTQPSVMNSMSPPAMNSMSPQAMNSMSSSASIRSASSTAHSHHNSPYGHSHGGNPHTQYSQPGHGQGMQMVLHNPHQHPRRPHVRDEIILVSDDKVMAVRLAPRAQDTASISAKT